mgnify:CR=1 FL=1
MNPIILILLLIWEIYWKAHALWIAARKGDKNFFIGIGCSSESGKSDIVNETLEKMGPGKKYLNYTTILITGIDRNSHLKNVQKSILITRTH